MKKLLLTLSFFATVTANAQNYESVIDLNNVSNRAQYPTVIDGGVYAVNVWVSTAEERRGEVPLRASHFRDDNEMICEITGNLKVGEVVLQLKSLENNWKKQVKSNLYLNFNHSEVSSSCGINMAPFAGVNLVEVVTPRMVIELPFKDSHSTLKLALKPLTNLRAQYNVLQDNNKLIISNGGQAVRDLLQASVEEILSYELSLVKSGSYYYFGQEDVSLRKVK